MTMINIDTDKLYTTKEIGDILGISRIAAFNRIKKGEIKAQMIGKSYIVKGRDLQEYIHPTGELTDRKKELIDTIVKKVVDEYGEALKKLGKE